MVGFLKKFSDLKSKDTKRVFTNFLSLSVLQGANLLLPLITFPYLVRVLGIEGFGLIQFALATIAYFEIVTDYGFDLSATRQISIHRNDKEKMISIFSSVLTIKAVLCFVSFGLLALLVFSFGKFSEFWMIYLLTFGRVVGHFIFPIWFFQGMERMKISTYLNLTAKFIFTVAIFIFVKAKEDIYLVPIFNSLGFIIAGIIALVEIYYVFGVSFKFQSKEILIEQLKDGWHIFLSRIYVNIYTTTNTFLLGVMTNNLIVGYYSVAAKIVEAFNSVFQPANNALYPYMSKLYHDNVKKFYELVRQMNIVYFVMAVCILTGAFFLGKFAIEVVNGKFDQEIYVIYNILIFKTLVSPYAYFFSNVFINQNRKAQYLKVVKYTFVANLLSVPVCVYFFSGVGMAFAVLFVSVFHVWLFLRFKLNAEEPKSPVTDVEPQPIEQF